MKIAISGTGVENIGQIVVQGRPFYLRKCYCNPNIYLGLMVQMKAFCGWWYGKQEFDSGGSTALWIFNDGDWSFKWAGWNKSTKWTN